MKRIFLCIILVLCSLDSFCTKVHEECLGSIDNLVCMDLYVQNPEIFVRHKFFDAVEKESARDFCILLKSTAKITSSVPALTIFLLGGMVLFDKFKQQFAIGDGRQLGMDDNEHLFKYALSFFSAFGISFGVSFFVYRNLNKFVNWVLPEKNYKKGSYIVVKEFLTNWPTYKQCTPIMFHTFFERLYTCYIKGESIENVDNPEEAGCVISDRTLKDSAYDIVKHIRLILDGKITFSSESDDEPVEPVELIPEA